MMRHFFQKQALVSRTCICTSAALHQVKRMHTSAGVVGRTRLVALQQGGQQAGILVQHLPQAAQRLLVQRYVLLRQEHLTRCQHLGSRGRSGAAAAPVIGQHSSCGCSLLALAMLAGPLRCGACSPELIMHTCWPPEGAGRVPQARADWRAAAIRNKVMSSTSWKSRPGWGLARPLAGFRGLCVGVAVPCPQVHMSAPASSCSTAGHTCLLACLQAGSVRQQLVPGIKAGCCA